MIRYLTGATNVQVEAAIAHRPEFGLMVQPNNSYTLYIPRYQCWAADNGAFSVKGGFDPGRFGRMLHLASPHRASCLFVVAPDCLRVAADGAVTGDARGTLKQYPAWARKIRGLGYPVALVAQDGLEDLLDRVPWRSVDVLFLGGSTGWKLSHRAKACVEAAQRRGKPTHMGRVNTYCRLRLADQWGVTTADGTCLAFGPASNVPKVKGWFHQLRSADAQLALAL